MWTKKQYNKWQRQRRKKFGNVWTHKYEKTPKGFLVRKYRNMQSRVLGIQKPKAHLYKGLYLLPREDFYEWSLEDFWFWELFHSWTDSNYDRKLCPTVDRIDSSKGYTLKNMKWVTHSENSSRSSKNRHKLKI